MHYIHILQIFKTTKRNLLVLDSLHWKEFIFISQQKTCKHT